MSGRVSGLPRWRRVRRSARRARCPPPPGTTAGAGAAAPSASPSRGCCHDGVGKVAEAGGVLRVGLLVSVPGPLEEFGSSPERRRRGRKRRAELGSILARRASGDLVEQAPAGQVGDEGAVAAPQGLTPLAHSLVG